MNGKLTVFKNHRKSYVHTNQKFIKNAKNGPFRRFFENPEMQSNSVTRQVNFNRKKKMMENAKIEKLKCDILGDFQTL